MVETVAIERLLVKISGLCELARGLPEGKARKSCIEQVKGALQEIEDLLGDEDLYEFLKAHSLKSKVPFDLRKEV